MTYSYPSVYRYVLPDTPKDILDTASIDVFELTIGSLVYSPTSVIDDLVDSAWERFGRRPIGDFDYEYWIEVFNDAVVHEYRWYSKALPLILSADMLSLYVNTGSMTESDSVTSESDSTTNVAGESDATNTTTLGSVNTKGGTVVVGQETMPDTVSASSYLAGRNTTTDTTTSTDSGENEVVIAETNSNESVSEGTTTTTRTHTIHDNRKDKLTIEITMEIAKKLDDLNELYLSKLDKYFMSRW